MWFIWSKRPESVLWLLIVWITTRWFKKIMIVWLRSQFISGRLSLPTFISCSWTKTNRLASRITLNVYMCYIYLWSLHANHYVWQLIKALLSVWIRYLSIKETLRGKVFINLSSCVLVFRELEEILLSCFIRQLKMSTWLVLLLFLLHDLLSNSWSLLHSFRNWRICSYKPTASHLIFKTFLKHWDTFLLLCFNFMPHRSYFPLLLTPLGHDISGLILHSNVSAPILH